MKKFLKVFGAWIGVIISMQVVLIMGSYYAVNQYIEIASENYWPLIKSTIFIGALGALFIAILECVDMKWKRR